jgi:hypothetical protein
MLEDGLFERFPCDAVYALHTGPGLPVGTIATGIGPIMAGGGTFEVTFTGTGGHGGQGAHLTPDLTVAQATYVMALQTIVSRNVPSLNDVRPQLQGALHTGLPSSACPTISCPAAATRAANVSRTAWLSSTRTMRIASSSFPLPLPTIHRGPGRRLGAWRAPLRSGPTTRSKHATPMR